MTFPSQSLEKPKEEQIVADSSVPPAHGPGFGGQVSTRLATIVLWVAVAAASFHLAYAFRQGSVFILIYLFALLQLARAETWRMSFYGGLAVGLLIAGMRLVFFWRIFPGGAIALWLVYAFWIALFVAIARLSLRLASRPSCAWALIPFLWCGLEYFRSELYYLRFAWLNVGFAFGESPPVVPLRWLGAYGVGCVLMGFACLTAAAWGRSKARSILWLALGNVLAWVGGILPHGQADSPSPAQVLVAGVQMEFPTENEVVSRLNELIQKHPEAELLVLSEYTLDGPVPDRVKKWCRQHQRYLIVGGKDPAAENNFYDTAFVVSPEGEITFRQAKSVPIQFFKDGLPAIEQRLWKSPWGEIGICICYDLSYRRVTDRLIQLGAEALVVPTMDVADWGRGQHELHARVAPVRAAEYGVPIFRVASSGISQLVDREGHVIASAGFPGDGATLAGILQMRGRGRLPLDHWLGPISAIIAAAVMVWSLLRLRAKPFGKLFGWFVPHSGIITPDKTC